MNREEILKLLDERQYKELREALESIHPVDIAELLVDLEERYIIFIFRMLDKDRAAETFTEMSSDTRETLLMALTDSEIKEFMDEML